MRQRSHRVMFFDESGSLGSKGGRHRAAKEFVIAALSYDAGNGALKRDIKRIVEVITTMCRRRSGGPIDEIKWAHMVAAEKSAFAKKCASLHRKYGDLVDAQAVVLDKARMGRECQGNMEYVYVKLMADMCQPIALRHDTLSIYHDMRTERAFATGWFSEYLSMRLMTQNRESRNIDYSQVRSEESKAIQFADMLAGMIHDANKSYLNVCRAMVDIRLIGDPFAETAKSSDPGAPEMRREKKIPRGKKRVPTFDISADRRQQEKGRGSPGLPSGGRRSLVERQGQEAESHSPTWEVRQQHNLPGSFKHIAANDCDDNLSGISGR